MFVNAAGARCKRTNLYMSYFGLLHPSFHFHLDKVSIAPQSEKVNYRISSVVEIRTEDSESEIDHELGTVLVGGVEEDGS